MKLEPGKTYSTLDLMGVVKTNRIYDEIELEVREQIAQEIEAATESIQDKCKCGEPFLILMDGRDTVFAAIARGKK